MSLNTSPLKGTRGGKRSGAGRPSYKPSDADRATVVVMSACGKDHHQIAACLGDNGLTDTTLRKHFARELAIAKDKLDGICMTGIAKSMQNGEAWALCFYAKCRMGWRETQKIEHSGGISIIDAILGGDPGDAA